MFFVFFFVFVFVFVFYHPTIEVVTFRLRGWCMLGVFLLSALTHLGYERQDLLSPFECMCTQTKPRFILSSERVWGKESKLMLTPREKSPLPKILPGGGWNPRRCIKEDSEPNTLPTSPLFLIQLQVHEYSSKTLQPVTVFVGCKDLT